MAPRTGKLIVMEALAATRVCFLAIAAVTISAWSWPGSEGPTVRQPSFAVHA
jgi:hypothetical protein